jgi:hypothetical protein
MITCPRCSSTRVAYFRLDSDWGDCGSFSPANTDGRYEPHPDAGYTRDDDRVFDGVERIDIECAVCLECHSCFEL